MTTARIRALAVLLDEGRVLVVGGMNALEGGITASGDGYTVVWYGALASVERFDPTTGVFTTVGDMAEPRAQPGVVAQPGGGALVICGITSGTGGRADSVELFDGTSGTFSTLAATEPAGDSFCAGGAYALPGGTVLATGISNRLDVTYLFDPVALTFSVIPSPVQVESGVQFGNGDVLFPSGPSATLFVAATHAFMTLPKLTFESPSMLSLLADGSALLAGSSISHQTAQVYQHPVSIATTDAGTADAQ
jgi:hypothetical protein